MRDSQIRGAKMAFKYSSEFLGQLANFYGKNSDLYRYARNGGGFLDCLIADKLQAEEKLFSGKNILKMIESVGVEETVTVVQKMVENRKVEEGFQKEAKRQTLQHWEKVKVHYNER